MKSKIAYSRYVICTTVIVMLALFIALIATVHEKPVFFSLLAVYLFLLIFAFFYGAMYIKTDSDYITMGSILRKKKIPVCDIESIELFKPTMGAIRIFGSGGFMGYVGLFKEGDVGRYYAFYGKSSDCFLVRMKNGDKYVLGCENPKAMVDDIISQTRLK